MPIYARKCPACGGEKELFLHMSERDMEIICEDCHIVMRKVVTAPAKTATLWNAGWNAGLDGTGVYSKALGRKVSNRREEEKILESKGFIAESELGSHWFEDNQAKMAEKWRAQDALSDNYKKLLAEGHSPETAISETFTAEKCLDGTLDSIYDTKISI
jgi:putative FmdB family regulatory protein